MAPRIEMGELVTDGATTGIFFMGDSIMWNGVHIVRYYVRNETGIHELRSMRHVNPL